MMKVKTQLDKLYLKYNRREFVHPDPLEFVYNYDNPKDREIAALIASSLAYGRVSQILKSVSVVLEKMSPSPFVFLTKSSGPDIKNIFKNFKHRFTTGYELSRLMIGIKNVIRQHGSLKKCFLTGFKKDHATVMPALSSFTKIISGCPSLVPIPERGSACKRLNLFLRWMVRKDNVDPGGWNNIPPSKLIIPLDTHMHKMGLCMGLTKRKQADLKTALEITKAFAKLDPKDPVKYDFTLTRFGIRSDMGKIKQEFVDTCSIYGKKGAQT